VVKGWFPVAREVTGRFAKKNMDDNLTRISPGTHTSAPSHKVAIPSHTSKDSYGSGMGVVWEWGSHYWRSLEFPLIST